MTDVRIFQSTVPANAPGTATARPDDLATLAARRQQQTVQGTAIASGDSLFPAASAPGMLPNLLGGDGRPESGGVLKAPNVGVFQGDDSARTAEPAPQAAVPVRSEQLESEPLGVAYAEMAAPQKEHAIRQLEVEVQNHVVDENGSVRRTGSGAAVLEVNPKIPRVDSAAVYLAEDGVAAHAALFKAMEQRGIAARPVDSYDGYTVGFEVDDRDVVPFMDAVRFLEPSGLEARDGRVYVKFDPSNVVNRHFTKHPFGTKGGR